jgi:hypothetical protein
VSAIAWEYRRDALADDIRRLRRRFASNENAWSGVYIADRLASHLDALDALLEPCAAEFVAAGFDVDEALGIIDRHADELWRRLGGRPRP